MLRERYTPTTGREDVRERRCRYLPSRGFPGRIEKGEFDAIMTSSLARARFFDRLSPYYDEACQAIYNRILSTWTPAAVIEDRELYFAHPTITIFTPGQPVSP